MAYTSEIEKLERRWNENPLGLTFAPLAEAYRKAADHTRALELLELGLAQHPNYVPAHIVRGRCYLDTNNHQAAEQAFLRVLELDPENAIALRSIADICERAGRVPEAIRRLEMLIEVDRSNEDARHQLHRLRTAPSAPVQSPEAPAVPAATQLAGLVQPPEPPGLMESVGSDESLESVTSEPVADVGEDDLTGISVYEPDDLAPAGRSEFQLPSDSEELRPSGDRLSDVVLGSEITEQSLSVEYAGERVVADAELTPEAEVPVTGTVSESLPEVMAPIPDAAASATSWAGSIFEPRMPEAEEPDAAVEAPSLLEDEAYIAEPREPFAPSESVPERAPVETAPAYAEAAPEPIRSEESVDAPAETQPGPLADLKPELMPEPLPEPMPEPEVEEQPAFAPASEAVEQEQSSPEPEPALVVTESMAEVFLRQGHAELALAVYTQLLQRDPENQRVTDAISRLRDTLAPPAPAAPAAPRYDAVSTGGVSIAARLGELLGAARPAVAASVHPPAFEAPRRSAEPTRPAEESLSLSSVFGEEAGSAPVGPASGPAESAESEPSFDEFFAPQETAELPSTPVPKQEAAGAPVQSGEDLERFNTWLRGLKG